MTGFLLRSEQYLRNIIIFVYKKSAFVMSIFAIVKGDLLSTAVRNAYFHQGKESMVNTFLGASQMRSLLFKAIVPNLISFHC